MPDEGRGGEGALAEQSISATGPTGNLRPVVSHGSRLCWAAATRLAPTMPVRTRF